MAARRATKAAAAAPVTVDKAKGKAPAKKSASRKPVVVDKSAGKVSPADPGFTGNEHVDNSDLKGPLDQMEAQTPFDPAAQPTIGGPVHHEPTPEALASARPADRFP